MFLREFRVQFYVMRELFLALWSYWLVTVQGIKYYNCTDPTFMDGKICQQYLTF